MPSGAHVDHLFSVEEQKIPEPEWGFTSYNNRKTSLILKSNEYFVRYINR